MLSPHQIIKKVAKLVNRGNTCYINRKNRKIVTIAPEDESDLDPELTIEKCIIVPPMPKQSLSMVMQDFLLEVTDNSIKKELVNALRRKSPMRNFMQVIDNSIDVGQHWRRYRAERYEQYVRQVFVDEYNH